MPTTILKSKWSARPEGALRFGDSPPALCFARGTLARMLGPGRHGQVMEAVHRHSGKTVALKFISLEDCPDSAAAWVEISALHTLHHPHVVKLYDVIRTATDTVLVLECLTDGALFDYLISRHRLSRRMARKFFRQILSAVDYCHRHGVVHRDLKVSLGLLWPACVIVIVRDSVCDSDSVW